MFAFRDLHRFNAPQWTDRSKTKHRRVKFSLIHAHSFAGAILRNKQTLLWSNRPHKIKTSKISFQILQSDCISWHSGHRVIERPIKEND